MTYGSVSYRWDTERFRLSLGSRKELRDMDLLQIAGHLSLDHDAYVEGPHHFDDYSMVHVIGRNGKGIGITVYSDPKWPHGELNVWGVEETETKGTYGWCIKSETLPLGVEYNTTWERIQEVMGKICPRETIG